MDIDYVSPDPEVGDFGWAQRGFVAEVEKQYNSGKPVRIIVLKARQLGISTVTEGILFNWTFMHPGTNGLVLAHENEPSQQLFGITKLYWEQWPFRDYYTLKYATKQHMQWLETRSQLRIATAKNLQSGRASTLHAIHASEAAFYLDPATLFTGLNQTLPHKHGTIVVLESTANGVGNWFHEQWLKAEVGEIDYVPMFFPWFKHPEYRMHTTLSVKSELDPEERQLVRLGADYENIAWRRWAIPNKSSGDLDDFHQEYPSTPEEAFITSGNPVFSAYHLKECYVPLQGIRGLLVDNPNGTVSFRRDPDGNLTIFKAPRTGDRRQDRYFVGGDPSETIAGDPGCIQVINRQTLEQVAVWHGHTNPQLFAQEMIRVGKFYNWATLCPEVDHSGAATIALIIAKGYPNIWHHRAPDRLDSKQASFGWWSNWQRKSWAIGHLQRLVIDHSIIVHDRRTYNECLTYVTREDGTMGNADRDTHDDTVMALAISYTASSTEGPFMPDVDRVNPVLDIYKQEFDDLDVYAGSGR